VKIQALLISAAVLSIPLSSQSAAPPVLAQPLTQPQDEAYGKLIKDHLQDPRFSTELVDHMPLSDTVPSPLKFFGRIPGTPGELTYAKDIQRYYEELAKTSPNVHFWKMGVSEEGRDQVAIAIGTPEAIKNLEKYKADLAALGDPRKTTPEQAQQLIKTAKPIYWVTSGIHSPETGGPEMLIELAYRLAVEDTPFIKNIRENSIVIINPVVEVDGREKQVDTYYYGKKTGKPRPPLMYWGKYVAHDNNRDGMGQYLKLTQNMTRGVLEWHPTVFHDLHEAQSYLYVSTGTGPYNPSLSPLQTQEWWQLAQSELTEMSKRDVPGVFTYGFYDGWVPNYLFWIANTHNSLGRFYEVQSYGPDLNPDLRVAPEARSREWFRPNPPLASVKWGPRNNTNIQESALLFAISAVATQRELYLENYWTKSKQSVEKGKTGPINAWVIPAAQTASLNVVDMINELRRQGVEISKADSAFTAGGVQVAAGDYVIRADQPYRTLADMYLSIQNYPVSNPRPYDDTGWTMQFLRNIDLKYVTDPTVLQKPMTLITGEIKPAGSISGSGSTILVNHTGENELVSLRFRLKDVKMRAAEAEFEAGGRKYAAGTFIIAGADRAKVEPVIAQLGLKGEAVAAAPDVKSHALTIPRIGYLHSWANTQDEGWWRAAFDRYGIPYTYFADIKVREGGLRGKYDIIVYPTVGQGAAQQVTGVPKNGPDAIPYKKSALTPNLGANDQADDIRGGLGLDGLAELKKFVQAGGTLIGDGSTVELLANYGAAPGVAVTAPTELYTKGAVMRGVFTDKTSPLAYGYAGKEMPIYFASDPVLSITTGPRATPTVDRRRGTNPLAQNFAPNVVPVPLSPWNGAVDPSAPKEPAGAGMTTEDMRRQRDGNAPQTRFPRSVMEFPTKASDILLSGMLSGGETLTRKQLIVDVPDGAGHMVLFALRPYWRWQTQGSYFLGFNAILNWDNLDAGAKSPAAPAAAPARTASR
jgi:hypothetical protein